MVDALKEARVQRLQESRARDSTTKRARALQACKQLLEAGLPVTFTRVAQEARVSTWLVYNASEVRAAIETARELQTRHGLSSSQPRPDEPHTSSASLRTDLVLARESNRLLREEVTALKEDLQRRFGLEVECLGAPELLARVQELESLNIELRRESAARDREIIKLTRKAEELQAENEAKAEVLRAMMFARNAVPGLEP